MASNEYRSPLISDLIHEITNQSSGNTANLALGKQKQSQKFVYLTQQSSESTLNGMDLQAERDRTDAKIETSEARIDVKFANMDGKLDRLLSEMQGVRTDTKNSRNVVATAVIGSALALAALIIAMFSFGAAQFYNGTVIRDMVHNEMTERLSSQATPQK